MFGYVQANRQALTEQDRKKYKSFYCGLCRELKQSYGRTGMLSLSYDMTFLTLLLADLYDEKIHTNCEYCIMSPLKKKTCTRSKATKYSADMCILLTYYSLLDHQKDHDRGASKSYTKSLEKFIPTLEKKYPRQASSIHNNLALLDKAEEKNEQDPEKLSSYFGALLGDIFVVKDDNWAKELFAIGQGLGRFIYLADAFLDLKKDLKHNSFNTFSNIKDDKNFKSQVTDLLSWAASDAAKAYEYLPLDEHCTILQNIIYSGIWTQIEVKNKK